jgi:hypothetical protein
MEYGVGRSKCKVRLYSLASYERGATGDDGAKVKVSPITVGMGTLCEAQNVEGGRVKTSKTERRETRDERYHKRGVRGLIKTWQQNYSLLNY